MILIALTGGPPKIAGRGRRTRTFEHLGTAASEFGLDLLVTTPNDWLYSRGRVQGWKFSSQQGHERWRETTVSMFNAVVYDAMYLADLKQYRTTYRRWKSYIDKGNIPSFNPVLPAKDVIYQDLVFSEDLASHVPETLYHVKPEIIIARLKRGQSLWLKPIYGSGGRNMLWIRYLGGERYKVIAERFYGKTLRKTMNEAELRQVLAYALQRRSYMVQEHIPLLHTPDGRKFDIRVTVQRNHTGNWQVVAVTGRFGAKDSALTNFHAGGRVESLTHPTSTQVAQLQKMGLDTDDLVRGTRLVISAAELLQQRYRALGILGVDIGQSESGKQFVYDFNGRPGRDILTDQEVEAAMYSVAGYASYLGQMARPDSARPNRA